MYNSIRKKITLNKITNLNTLLEFDTICLIDLDNKKIKLTRYLTDILMRRNPSNKLLNTQFSRNPSDKSENCITRCLSKTR